MGSHWVGGEEKLIPPLPDVRRTIHDVHHNRLGRRDNRPQPANVTVLKGINGTTVYRSSIGCPVTESGPA